MSVMLFRRGLRVSCSSSRSGWGRRSVWKISEAYSNIFRGISLAFSCHCLWTNMAGTTKVPAAIVGKNKSQ